MAIWLRVLVAMSSSAVKSRPRRLRILHRGWQHTDSGHSGSAEPLHRKHRCSLTFSRSPSTTENHGVPGSTLGLGTIQVLPNQSLLRAARLARRARRCRRAHGGHRRRAVWGASPIHSLERLQAHLQTVRRTDKHDLAPGFGRVVLPDALYRAACSGPSRFAAESQQPSVLLAANNRR